MPAEGDRGQQGHGQGLAHGRPGAARSPRAATRGRSRPAPARPPGAPRPAGPWRPWPRAAGAGPSGVDPEPLQHAVAALEPGGDPEGDHRRRHDGQGEDPRDEEGDRLRWCRSAPRGPSRRRPGRPPGCPIGEEQRLPAPQRHAGLGPHLGRQSALTDCPGLGAASVGRAVLAVLGSRFACDRAPGRSPRATGPARRSVRVASCSASQAARRAVSAGERGGGHPVAAGRLLGHVGPEARRRGPPTSRPAGAPKVTSGRLRPRRRPARPGSPGPRPGPRRTITTRSAMPLGLGQLVGGEHHAHPALGQAGHDRRASAGGPRGRRRPSARPRRPPRAGPPGPGPARAAAARPPRGGARGWRATRVSDDQVEQAVGVLGRRRSRRRTGRGPGGARASGRSRRAGASPRSGAPAPGGRPPGRGRGPAPGPPPGGGSPRGSRRWRSSRHRSDRGGPAPRPAEAWSDSPSTAVAAPVADDQLLDLDRRRRPPGRSGLVGRAGIGLHATVGAAMIDIRAGPRRPGCGEGRARPAGASTRPRSTGCAALDAAHRRRPGPAGVAAGRGEGDLPAGGRGPQGRGRCDAPSELAGREPSARASERTAAVDGRRRRASRSAGRCSTCPTCPSDEAPDGAGPEDNVVVREWWPGGRRRAGGPVPAEHQRVPHWEVGETLGLLDMARGRPAGRLDVPPLPGCRGPAAAGAHLVRPRPPRRRLRGDPPAHPGAHRDDDLDRPPAQVLRRGLPRRARRPVGHPDGRGAAHLDAPRRDPGRGRPPGAADGGDRSASAARPAPPGATPGASCGSTSSRRSSCSPTPRAEQAPAVHADILARAEGLLRAISASRYRVLDLCAGDLGASSARTFDLEVYSPGCDRWLEVSSVSWFRDYQARRANVRYRPAPAAAAGSGAHRQRLGPGLGPHLGGPGRDRPPARRLGPVPRVPGAVAGVDGGARPLNGWGGSHHVVVLSRRSPRPGRRAAPRSRR